MLTVSHSLQRLEFVQEKCQIRPVAIRRDASLTSVRLGDEVRDVFICLGGEVIAMVLIEAISRLRGNILGNQESAEQETFSHNGILEYPQYTRPLEFRGQRVPEVLLSGHHARILEWRSQQARQRTLQRRPDLLTEKHKGKDARFDESS